MVQMCRRVERAPERRWCGLTRRVRRATTARPAPSTPRIPLVLRVPGPTRPISCRHRTGTGLLHQPWLGSDVRAALPVLSARRAASAPAPRSTRLATARPATTARRAHRRPRSSPAPPAPTRPAPIWPRPASAQPAPSVSTASAAGPRSAATAQRATFARQGRLAPRPTRASLARTAQWYALLAMVSVGV
jgi:hypothetical protein